MKIISWNVNGLRAAHKKDFLLWFKKIKADIFCLQEIKLNHEQIPEELARIRNYHLIINSAQKKGYSGTLIYSKIKPKNIATKIGFNSFDNEGRFLKLKFANFTLINIYLPHGGRDKSKLAYKLECYRRLFKYLKKIKKQKVILIGDFNVAHQEIDLERHRHNNDNIMFTPREREQISKIINLGFIDSFRKFNQKSGSYTWWPYAFNARARNLGWRIDYIFISGDYSSKLKRAKIYKRVLGSDHCPIGIELK